MPNAKQMAGRNAPSEGRWAARSLLTSEGWAAGPSRPAAHILLRCGSVWSREANPWGLFLPPPLSPFPPLSSSFCFLNFESFFTLSSSLLLHLLFSFLVEGEDGGSRAMRRVWGEKGKWQLLTFPSRPDTHS